MHKLQRLSLCCVCTPLLPVPAGQLLFLPTHPTHEEGDVGYPLGLLVPIPRPQRRASKQCLLHCPPAQVCLPRTGGDGSAGRGQCRMRAHRGRLRVVAAALPGWLKGTQQQMQGRHCEWRLPLFWPWALSELGGLESHPAFGQIPSGFAHSFSFHE